MKTIKKNIKRLHAQRTMWKSKGKNIYVIIFVNNNKYVDVKCLEGSNHEMYYLLL
jgi:predicted nucleic-acid-binding Zn-ribbon protein